MRVVVTGGRDYDDKDFIFQALDFFRKQRGITELIHGGARGVDMLCSMWARENNISIRVFEPDWNRYGRAAGPVRNKVMLNENPDVVIAFPGGKGTANMIKTAKAQGYEVIEYRKAEWRNTGYSKVYYEITYIMK